jgi:hypothetical protein
MDLGPDTPQRSIAHSVQPAPTRPISGNHLKAKFVEHTY